jgi:hypothetical protein
MKRYMNKNVKVLLILAVLVAVALLSAFWATRIEQFPSPQPFLPLEPRDFPIDRIRGDLELYYMVNSIISSINVALLVILLITYIDIYRKTRSEFTIGLIIFSMVLLSYGLVSNPLVRWVFGFRAFGLGPFAMLPDLFICVALAVLLYFSVKY